MHLRRRHIACLLLLTVVFTFAASFIWENGLEGVISEWLGWPYEAEFEAAERWRFIIISTSFAAVAQVVPGILLATLVGRLSAAFRGAVMSEEASRAMAFQDPLTGLANRRHLRERMEALFHAKVRYKLLLVDLDHFKSVNDAYGHSVGDGLLVRVADRLRAVVGPKGCLARLGGDELAVLVEGEPQVADAIAHAIIASFSQPFEIGEANLSVGCSIGMCCTDVACDPEELLKCADLALYDAKREGGGHVTCYQPGMLEAVIERGRLEADFRAAIREGQFHLAYQPLFDLRADRVCGYEALIRWQHPTAGTVSPVMFIPLAEETGQIVAIGEWVLKEACRQAVSWPTHQHVAVNVSPAQFHSPLLFAHITAALAESGLPPHRLEIELTETAMVEDGPGIAHALAALRALGVTVALDDFGTGYSSLTHLREFPLDRIKIDRSFVATAGTDPHSKAVLKAVVQIGRDLGISTLGEGVETAEQLALLRSLGCDAAQGYLIGKPERMEVDNMDITCLSA